LRLELPESKHQSSATYLLVKTANHSNIAILCRRQPRHPEPRVPALERAIHAYIERNNADPKPFVWTKSAHDIIGNVNCGRAALKMPLKRLDKL
jgi:hypothetical protein